MSTPEVRHFAIDLFDPATKLTDEGELGTWIQAFPLGEWDHPGYGRIKMTSDRVARFADNVNERVRGTDLDIDYDHKALTTKAAGWVKSARNDGTNGLTLLIEWTPSARKSLAEKEFRYFSPEYVESWKRPSDSKVFKDVLFGGGLTNRPFLKEIAPINLSDLGLNQEGDDVEELMKALAEALNLKLSDDGDKDQKAVLEAIKRLAEPKPPTSNDEQLQKLAETNDVVAKLLADRDEDRKRMAALEAANRLSETARQLGELNTDKVGLPPAFVESMRDALVLTDSRVASKVIDALKELTKTGLIQLGEIGSRRTNDSPEDAIKVFNDKIEALRKEDPKMSYRDAVDRVVLAEPTIWDAYNDAQLTRVD